MQPLTLCAYEVDVEPVVDTLMKLNAGRWV